MCTWEEIGEKWSRAQRMGWQAIQAAMDVGEELQQKKIETPVGEFSHACEVLGLKRDTRSRLMRLALHRELIEEHKPESMRGALALLPKEPSKPRKKQITVNKEQVNKYEAFAKEPVKEQAKKLADKMVRVELDKLQTQAHDAVKAEMTALQEQLEKERERITDLMAETREKKQFYDDLVNHRTNGHDFRQGLKLLRQLAHPDRKEVSTSLQEKAMIEIQHLSRFLGF